MLYRVVRTINEWYALSIFWVFLGMFLLAFALIFVFPLGPILLLFASLAGLGIAVIAGRVLQGTQQSLARHALSQGRCPRCKSASPTRIALNQTWQCVQCGTRFADHGEEARPDQNF